MIFYLKLYGEYILKDTGTPTHVFCVSSVLCPYLSISDLLICPLLQLCLSLKQLLPIHISLLR